MKATSSFTAHFSDLIDPRLDNHNRLHSAEDILILTLIAVICGADSWVDIQEFGDEKYEELKDYLSLQNGIPSHDTIGRFFSLLDPLQFEECFINWVQSLVDMTSGEIIAIDGKRSRSSYDTKKNKSAIHMVSAWACKNSMVLGQLKTSDKSNEVTAIPKLIKKLNIVGATITIDAMGCQKNIAEIIHKQGGDYVLAVKGNQGKLHNSIVNSFEAAEKNAYQGMVYTKHETVDGDHGRIETRAYTAIPYMYLQHLNLNWSGIKSLIKVTSTRIIGEHKGMETRYFISSHEHDAKLIGNAIRSHWQVENNLHWIMDVTFSDDLCRIRLKNAAENFTVIKHLAINLLKKETSKKVGLACKRKKAGWGMRYMEKVLQGLQM